MRIEHIAMYVTDLEAARDFFVTYLGATPNEGYHNKTTNFRSYFLRFDDGARLEIDVDEGKLVQYRVHDIGDQAVEDQHQHIANGIKSIGNAKGSEIAAHDLVEAKGQQIQQIAAKGDTGCCE